MNKTEKVEKDYNLGLEEFKAKYANTPDLTEEYLEARWKWMVGEGTFAESVLAYQKTDAYKKRFLI